MMMRISRSLTVHCYSLLYLILAQIVSPLHFLNEEEKANVKNSFYRGNFSAVTTFLRRNHFNVLDTEDESPPLILQGDMAFPVDDIIMEALEGRTTNLVTAKNLWKVGDAAAHVHYFFDSDSKPKKDMVHEALKAWMNTTCLKITELPRANCSKKSPQAAICVKAPPSGCWSVVGRGSQPNEAAQPLALADGCGVPASVHEFGHALGLRHMQERSDREQFISLHPENLEVNISSENLEKAFKENWMQDSCANSKDEFDLPVPYDFMSIMHYHYTGLGDADQKGVYMTRDMRYQNMLMYRSDGGYLQSYYDLYTINTAYGCVKEWIKLCEANGKTVPKCENLGYVRKDCKCICPPAFTGPSCKNKVKDLFPPLPKAQVLLEVNEPKIVTFKESQFTSQPRELHDDWFDKHIQFITVVIRCENDTFAAAYIEQDSNKTTALWKESDYYMDNLGGFESGLYCITMMWGVSREGKLRAEYTSSFLRNEKDGLWFRSRINELDLVSRSGLSTWTEDDLSIRYYASLKMHVSFEPRAEHHLKVKECPYAPYCSQPAALGAALSAVTSVTGIAIIAAVVLLCLLIAAGICYSRKKNQQQDDSDEDSDDDEKEKHEEGSSGSSDTSSADD